MNDDYSSADWQRLVRKYENALSALKEIPIKDADKFSKVSRLLIAACERAIAWKAHEDPHQLARVADENFMGSGLKSMINTVAKLRELADEHKRGFDAIVWRALMQSGFPPETLKAAGYDFDENKYMGGSFVRAFLASFHDLLKAETHADTRRGIKGKHMGGAHRHIVGPLNYPKHMDLVRKPVDARLRGLQFELEFHLRRYTGDRGIREISIDDTKPTCGRPHYRIIAEFTLAALGRDTADPSKDADAFKKVLKAQHGAPVKWWGWGKPDGASVSADGRVITYFVPNADD